MECVSCCKWQFDEVSSSIMESFLVFFLIPHLCPYPLVLKATDEKPGNAWQRVSNGTWLFFPSNEQKWSHLLRGVSNKVKKRQLERNVLMQTGRFPITLCWMSSWQQMKRGEEKKGLSVTLVIAAILVLQLEISKLLLSAGICWQLDLFGELFGGGWHYDASQSSTFTPPPRLLALK